MGNWSELRAQIEMAGSLSSWPASFREIPPMLQGLSSTEYDEFLTWFGPGTLGGFLHFAPFAYISGVDDQLGPLLSDADRHELLSEVGELLVFAETDNGDSCCWNPAESTSDCPSPIYLIPPRSFQSQKVASNLFEFLSRLVAGEDTFGVGVLDLLFTPGIPFGRLA